MALLWFLHSDQKKYIYIFLNGNSDTKIWSNNVVIRYWPTLSVEGYIIGVKEIGKLRQRWGKLSRSNDHVAKYWQLRSSWVLEVTNTIKPFVTLSRICFADVNDSSFSMSNNYTSATTGVLGSFSSSLSFGFFKPFYWMSILKTKGNLKKKTKRRYGSLSSLSLIVYGFASFYFGYVPSLVLGCGIQERGKMLWKCSFLAVLWVVWKKETVDVL